MSSSFPSAGESVAFPSKRARASAVLPEHPGASDAVATAAAIAVAIAFAVAVVVAVVVAVTVVVPGALGVDIPVADADVLRDTIELGVVAPVAVSFGVELPVAVAAAVVAGLGADSTGFTTGPGFTVFEFVLLVLGFLGLSSLSFFFSEVRQAIISRVN